ncbi:MAG: methyltransferase domain-containing protein [Magnetococcales bacterium]|nr:methyltransferase domain-containing protein [Nitrospirota bacterium]
MRRHPIGKVDFGELRILKPISSGFGYDRGLPIDRYYIEGFLEEHSSDILGKVLEIKDNSYTTRFGSGRVTESHVLDKNPGPLVTIVEDLNSGDSIPSAMFDCIIFTNTLQYVYNFGKAVETIHRILAPGGVLLATLPSISRTCFFDSFVDLWRFTGGSAKMLFEKHFLPTNVQIRTYGNVLTAISFLQGLASSELTKEEFDFSDPDFQIIVAVRAVKV